MIPKPFEQDKIEELLDLHERITMRAREIMKQKNHDYTTGSVDPLANFRYAELLNVPIRRGILIRAFDKIKRLVTFAELGWCAIRNEGIEDTVIDAINYLVLWLYSYHEECAKKEQLRHYISHIVDHLLILNKH